MPKLINEEVHAGMLEGKPACLKRCKTKRLALQFSAQILQLITHHQLSHKEQTETSKSHKKNDRDLRCACAQSWNYKAHHGESGRNIDASLPELIPEKEEQPRNRLLLRDISDFVSP